MVTYSVVVVFGAVWVGISQWRFPANRLGAVVAYFDIALASCYAISLLLFIVICRGDIPIPDVRRMDIAHVKSPFS